jgi:hypothetical protein
MRDYFVAKTPNGKFIGAYTIEQIAARVQAGEIQEDYVVTESNGPSYNQLLKMGSATWVTISQLLSSAPAACPTTTPVTAVLTEFVERRSGWATFLRVVGGINILVGLIGFVASDDKRIGGILLAIGLVGVIQSFFFAFLVDVFTDIRWFIKKIADERSHDA